MKKVLYTLFCFVVIAAMCSCRKHMQHISKSIVIDTTIASGSQYVLDLKPYGDADDVAAITRQGTYYTTSEIINTAGTFSPVYHYSASAKTSVNDQVVISITEGNHGNGGGRHNSDSTTVTINFTIQ